MSASRDAIMAAKLAGALRLLMNYVGGWDLPSTHPCGIGRDVLKEWDNAHAADLKTTFIAMIESERDATGDATRREFLHRLLGSLRKV